MDEKEILEFNEISGKAEAYLINQLNIPPSVVAIYRRNWRKIRDYLIKNNIKKYNKQIEDELLSLEYGNVRIGTLKSEKRYFERSVNFLREFRETGRISFPAKVKIEFKLIGQIGEVIEAFLLFKKLEMGCANQTLRYNRRHLSQLNAFCEDNNINNITKFDASLVLSYITSLSNTKALAQAVLVIRCFLKYLYMEKYIDTDYNEKIPAYRSIRQPKLVSVYTTEEIEKLISSVDQSHRSGKKAYIIILLAARLGLRASDISLLKLGDIDWEKNTITITQQKTGKQVHLPLLTEIGNALINYLRHARPKCKQPFIFLQERPPYKPLVGNSYITQTVQKAFKRSGVPINNRKFGPHSLRHSLASRLLEKSTTLPVISEVLGHSNSDSTKYYLRIDIASMRKCRIDVPPVNNKFYEQGGSYFYG